MNHKNFYSVLVFSALLTGGGANTFANEYIGCKGQGIGRNDGSVVDVASELSSAASRIKTICEKEIPPRLKQIRQAASECTKGSATNGKQSAMEISRTLQSFDKNLEDSCKQIRAGLEDAKKYCNERKAATLQLEKSVAVSSVTGSSEKGQKSAFNQKTNLSKTGQQVKDKLAQQAGAAAVSIYKKLPDFDEKNVRPLVPRVCVVVYDEGLEAKRAKREGTESKETSDRALDALVKNLKEKITSVEKNNNNIGSCKQLSARAGALDQLAALKKKNLWPNGKRAARALVTLSYNDCQIAAEFRREAEAAQKTSDQLNGELGLDPKGEKGLDHKMKQVKEESGGGGSGGSGSAKQTGPTGNPSAQGGGGSGGAVSEALKAAKVAQTRVETASATETTTQRAQEEQQQAPKTETVRKCGFFDIFARIQGKCVR